MELKLITDLDIYRKNLHQLYDEIYPLKGADTGEVIFTVVNEDGTTTME